MACVSGARSGLVVFASDFGTQDGAVSSMKGVAAGVDPALRLHDLTHEVPPFDVFEGAFRLAATAPHWPRGTVFVAVVDPGVGSARRAIVLETESGHRFVAPDNGLLTLVADGLGVSSIHRIDATRQRRAGSERSPTFDGRDLFALVGAKLAAGRLEPADVGPPLEAPMVRLDVAPPVLRREGGLVVLEGLIPVLDPRFGNVWTNLPGEHLMVHGVRVFDPVHVTIRHAGVTLFEREVPFASTFGDVPRGEPLLYVCSVETLALALHQDDFARRHGIGSGPEWSVELRFAAADAP